MNLKEQMAAKRAELEAATEPEAIKALADEINGLKAQMEAADQKAALLDSLKGETETEAKSSEPEAKSMGDVAVSLVKGIEFGEKFQKSAPVEFKLANTDVVSGYTTTDDRHVVIPAKNYKPTLRDLFSNESISTSSVKYMVEKSVAGDFGVTAEGAQKPQLSVEYEPKTVSVEKIAGFLKVSDEMIKDTPWIYDAVNGRLVNKFDKKEEDYLVGKLDAAITETAEYTADSGVALADAILAATTTIREHSDYDADAVVISPADYEMLRLAKDDANQYYGGGFFVGGYGNGSIAQAPNIWGLKTVVSSAVEEGTVIVGNFESAAVLHNGARELDINNRGDYDYTHNTATIRLEERLALAVYVPAAFVKLTVADGE